MILVKQQERQRFLKFAAVGAIGAVIDFVIFNLLSRFTPLTPLFSQAISFSVAVISNFIWNRYWTYPDSRSKSFSGQMVQFIVVSVIGLVIRTPIFAGMEPLLTGFFSSILPASFSLSPVFLAHNLALATAIVVVMFWNFIINRVWTYSDVK